MWLPIPGFEEYLCSEEGFIKPTSGRFKDRCLAGSVFKSGYRYVSLRNHNYRVNRIVAMTFLPQPTQPTESLQVDHIDKDKLNNHASNLRWVSCQQNNANRNQRRLIASPQTNNKLGERYISLGKGTYKLKMKLYNEVSFHRTLEAAIQRKQELIHQFSHQ